MFLNNVLTFFQDKLCPIYNKSFFLQKIDWLIFVNILLVILSSTIAPSDYIGYFAIFAIILTVVKLLTKQGEKFELTCADKLLLIYFIFVIISVAGSSLLYLSLKGFFKTLTYLGFYVSLVHFFKDNKDKIKYVFIAYAFAVAFETVVAFLQNFASVDEISGWQDTSRLNPEEVMTRVYGTLKPYNPNLFGAYMLACIPALITLPKKWGLPIAALAAGGVGIATRLKSKQLQQEKERLYKEVLKKHEAIIQALKREADANKERLDYLQSLNILLQRAIKDLKNDLGES